MRNQFEGVQLEARVFSRIVQYTEFVLFLPPFYYGNVWMAPSHIWSRCNGALRQLLRTDAEAVKELRFEHKLTNGAGGKLGD